MASDLSFIEHITDQLHLLGGLRHRKMFGEYALYLHDKVVALVCDNQLYVKTTPAGLDWLARWYGSAEQIPMGAPYPGAKPHLQASDLIDERETLTRLLQLTWEALPQPKPKAPPKAKTKTTTARKTAGPRTP